MKRFLLTTALALLPAAAYADTVAFNMIGAQWYAGTPSANVTYINNAAGSTFPQAYWGGNTPSNGNSNGDSGYTFTSPAVQPVVAALPPFPSADFTLGTFQHINFPIPTSTAITGINLAVTADVLITPSSGPAVDEGNLTFRFHFDHNETPNGDPSNHSEICPDGGHNGVGDNVNGCADHVQVSALDTTDSFLVNGDTYTVNIIGFEQGNVLTPSFWTEEGAVNTADLVANVNLFSAVVTGGVPELSTWTYSLIGFGMLGMLGFKRYAI